MSLKSSPRLSRPSLELELGHKGPVCGLDEAGRGPLAGPVVAACVYIPPEVRQESFWAQVNDSKKLTGKKRDALYDLIIAHTHYGISESSVQEIDEINILQASLLAMSRAYEGMISPLTLRTCGAPPSPRRGEGWGEGDKDPASWVALVDGNRKPKLSCQIRTVVKGDSISLSIAAASILAKVTRDRIMRDLCQKFPMYGWSRNAGYGTAEHLRAINDHGVTDYHRRTFAPIKSLLGDVA